MNAKRNIWQDKYHNPEKLIYLDSKRNLFFSTILQILEYLLHKRALKLYRSNQIRIPIRQNLGKNQDANNFECFLGSTLVECALLALVSIANRNDIVGTYVYKKSSKGSEVFRVSIANSGKLIETTFALYDKQVLLYYLLNEGFNPNPNPNSKNNTNIKIDFSVFFKFLKVRLDSKAHALRKRFSHRSENWHVGVVKNNSLQLDFSNWLDLPEVNNFSADPFLAKFNERYYVFVESISDGKGEIHVSEITAHGIVNLGVALKENFHLSFPYILNHNFENFMIPESSQAQEIRMYSAETFPLNWKLRHVLMENVLAVDSFVIYFDDNWYLFTNLSSGLVENYSSEFWIFTSKSLDNPHWLPHQRNPISMEAEKSRNGGFFIQENKMYRVNQVPGFSRYGFGFTVNEVHILSSDNYAEDCVSQQLGGFAQNHKGSHHLSHLDGYYAFDYSSNKKRAND